MAVTIIRRFNDRVEIHDGTAPELIGSPPFVVLRLMTDCGQIHIYRVVAHSEADPTPRLASGFCLVDAEMLEAIRAFNVDEVVRVVRLINPDPRFDRMIEGLGVMVGRSKKESEDFILQTYRDACKEKMKDVQDNIGDAFEGICGAQQAMQIACDEYARAKAYAASETPQVVQL